MKKISTTLEIKFNPKLNWLFFNSFLQFVRLFWVYHRFLFYFYFHFINSHKTSHLTFLLLFSYLDNHLHLHNRHIHRHRRIGFHIPRYLPKVRIQRPLQKSQTKPIMLMKSEISSSQHFFSLSILSNSLWDELTNERILLNIWTILWTLENQ